jgi:hypothetical protein
MGRVFVPRTSEKKRFVEGRRESSISTDLKIQASSFMRVQMVCLTNSQVERGRVVMGILMENGLPVMDAAGPKWLHLVMDPKRATVPAGLVVDLLPRDIIELDITAMPSFTKCPETVVFDPYSLKLVGTMVQDTVITHCLAPNPVLQPGENNVTAFEGCALVNAKNCRITPPKKVVQRTKENFALTFDLGENQYCLPVHDPWFLGILEAAPDILEKCPSHYIVVRQKKAGGPQDRIASVMTVMV